MRVCIPSLYIESNRESLSYTAELPRPRRRITELMLSVAENRYSYNIVVSPTLN